MNITNEIIELDPTLQFSSEGKWDEVEVADRGYHSFNDAGVECEVGEFLYAMVKILKPKFVLETGTHWGVGMAYLGMGLRDNGEGMLDTVEYNGENFLKAHNRRNQLGLAEYVTNYEADVRLFKPTHNYDMILLDTEPQTRFEELIKFFDCLNPGGFVFIHDLHRHMGQHENEEHGFGWPFGKLPFPIKQWVKTGRLRPFHFPTPRGFTGFYKPDLKNDYLWEGGDKNE